MEASKAGAPPLKFLGFFFFSVSDFSELLFPEERHVCVEGKTCVEDVVSGEVSGPEPNYLGPSLFLSIANQSITLLSV